ncbi:hypothetical protein [Streptomyces sp. NPDC058256]
MIASLGTTARERLLVLVTVLTEEPWFQDAIVENWRPDDGHRRALIPND